MILTAILHAVMIFNTFSHFNAKKLDKFHLIKSEIKEYTFLVHDWLLRWNRQTSNQSNDRKINLNIKRLISGNIYVNS